MDSVENLFVKAEDLLEVISQLQSREATVGVGLTEEWNAWRHLDVISNGWVRFTSYEKIQSDLSNL